MSNDSLDKMHYVDIHFQMISVNGYRGRNFTLNMNPRGQNTVFIMDGQTGKTTTIDLLRWCFKFPESMAIGSFSHMWVDNAHVLNENIAGSQSCEIIVCFTAMGVEDNHEHFFQYKRTTDGESDLNNKINSDKIREIKDALEIDHGANAKEKDDVHRFLREKFRFDECADYFCFDGEKARDLMQMASDSTKIADLVYLVNVRATHPKIEEYRRSLIGLQKRVLDEAKAKVTDKALGISIGKLNGKLTDLSLAEDELERTKVNIAYNSLALQQTKEKARGVQDQITAAKVKELVDRNKYETDKQNVTRDISEKRRQIYAAGLNWISTDMAPAINEIKTVVKERGKLPEPYHQDLIKNCLQSQCCEICGRPLNKAAEERIRGLERQVASHDVQIFLSEELAPRHSIDSRAEYDDIKSLFSEYNKLDNRIKSIKLSEQDAQLFSQKATLDAQVASFTAEIARLEQAKNTHEETVRTRKREVSDLQEKNAALKESKIILDRVVQSLSIVDAAGEKIKTKTIDIISSVISEGVSSILSTKFSAKLSQADGLMLGEDGFYGRERGGYSGRLILSYCFAEAMTLVDPIIVDTPSGNIGSQREELAKHLVANHRQVILMCLPGELSNFAPIVSGKTIEIKNKEK